jgi:hypothetical protein
MIAKPNDGFEIYFREKLWELIPAIYRHEDGLAENPGVLRALVAVIAKQAALLKRSQDRLWEDQFIELCNDWAVPYIGDLLGTRMLSALNQRGRRVDVAKTIYYRRRKGTPRILEELISDISGWDGKLVEAFQRLTRTRHGLDAMPARFAGRFTGTLPGGWANLQAPSASELSDGPFDEYFHTPDFRKPRGKDGRFGITKLNFHLYRLFAFEVKEVTPFALDASRFLFDPSGRNIQLFNKRKRPVSQEWEQWHSALEWELPAPIRCRLLAHAEYQLSEASIQELQDANGLSAGAATELRSVVGWRFKNEENLRRTLNTFTNQAELSSDAIFLPLLKYAILKDGGKNTLWPDALSVHTGSLPETIAKENMMAANLDNWSLPATTKQLAIDAERGRFSFLNTPLNVPVTANYHYGFSGAFGAGTYHRPAVEDAEPTLVVIPGIGTIGTTEMLSTGVVQVQDNKTYTINSDHLDIAAFSLQAANQNRPYLVLHADWILDSGAHEEATLVLDGLWIGAQGGSPFHIILRGDYECVMIRNCTLDPGGDDNALGQPLLPVSLIIEGNVEKLCIEKSITGPLRTQNDGLLEEAFLLDSIVQSIDVTVPAIAFGTGKTDLLRCTIFGSVLVHSLFASEVIMTLAADVDDTQSGCFRFSAAPTTSRLPRPYESFLFTTSDQHWFTSRRFGQAGFAQLSETAPPEIYRGGENGAEMGTFNSLLNPVKLDGLKVKVDEFMPFGLLPAFINET